MAYNNFYPYNPYVQQMPQQTNGLVSVRSKAEAQNYPVAAGNSVTFKDENAPYMYVKTMGFSQLDRPSFETFRLIKEDMEPEQVETDFVKKDDLKPIFERLEALEKPKKELFPDD